MDAIKVGNRLYHYYFTASCMVLEHPNGSREWVDKTKVAGVCWESIHRAEDKGVAIFTPEKIAKCIEQIQVIDHRRQHRLLGK